MALGIVGEEARMLGRVLILTIRAYQLAISPYLGRNCRFYPSCSAYCMGAIEKHGCVKGMFLGLSRLLRCHPFHQGGVDPVPDAFAWGHRHS